MYYDIPIIVAGIFLFYLIISLYRDDVTDLMKQRDLLVRDTPRNVGGENPNQYHEYFAMTPQFFLQKWRGHLKSPNPFIHPQKQDLAVYPLNLLKTAETYELDSKWNLSLTFAVPGSENPGTKQCVTFTIKKEEIIRFFRTLKDVCPTAPIPEKYAHLPYPEEKM